KSCVVRIMKFGFILGIAAVSLLFKLDQSELAVVENKHLDRQLVFYRGSEISHQHGKPAVAAQCDHLAIRVQELRADGGWQRKCHRGQIARQGKPLFSFEPEISRAPYGYCARIAA